MRFVHPTCDCQQPRRLSGTDIVNRYRVSRVDKGAPVADVKANHVRIVRDMVRMRRHLMIEGQRNLSGFFIRFFTTKLNAVCDMVEERARLRRGQAAADGYDAKAIEVNLGANEAIWKQAIEEVLGTNANVELITNYTPEVQSLAAKANARTSIFLGETPPANTALTILRRAQDMARKVTRINETTRSQLVRVVERSIAEGQTVGETLQAVRSSIPQIASSRVPTIVRTEVGNAIDHGTKQAIKDSKTVATVDVIGCTAVEPNIPTFDGRPTCNITGVPAHRVDELEFHPNHTGAIVPGSFIG